MRRLNFTNRHRISRHHIAVDAQVLNDGEVEATVQVDLSHLLEKFTPPPSHKVWIEVTGGTKQLVRHDLGSAKDRVVLTRRVLEGIHAGEGPQLRVKVVDLDSGRLWAASKSVRFETADIGDRPSILPVRVAPLDHILYKVELGEGSPSLVLNGEHDAMLEDVGGVRGLMQRPMFRFVVLPEVFRQILTFILVTEGDPLEDEEDDASWQKKWLEFAVSMNPEPRPDISNGPLPMMEWIAEATCQLARRLYRGGNPFDGAGGRW